MQEGNNRNENPVIYLDNAASSPLLDEVINSMLPYLKEAYGNPSSLHSHGRVASRAILHARRQVASLIKAKPHEIIFTSGGTESDNIAIKGVCRHSRKINPSKNHIITSSIEHEAVLEPCKDLENEGYRVSHLSVDRQGFVNPDHLETMINSNTLLISVMMANNEVGTIQPIEKMVKLVRALYGRSIIFHTDAVQAAGKIPIDVSSLDIDLMSISSHKINGPKGVGALYVRSGIKIDCIFHGGGQERLLRSGTENVPGIVGFGKASQMAEMNLTRDMLNVTQLRNQLVQTLIDTIPGCRLNGSPDNRLPGNVHFTFFGVNGEDLIIKLDEKGVSASTGSACSVKKQKASHVLKAMGFSFEEIAGSLRISIGKQNDSIEIERTAIIIKEIITQLREISPFKSKYSF